MDSNLNRVLGCRSNKSSDPFVVLTLEDEMRTDTPDQRKTEVRPNTLNPQFDQTFAFKMRPESRDIRLRVDVFDHDKIGSNDKIGCASFRLPCHPAQALSHRFLLLLVSGLG